MIGIVCLLAVAMQTSVRYMPPMPRPTRASYIKRTRRLQGKLSKNVGVCVCVFAMVRLYGKKRRRDRSWRQESAVKQSREGEVGGSHSPNHVP